MSMRAASARPARRTGRSHLSVLFDRDRAGRAMRLRRLVRTHAYAPLKALATPMEVNGYLRHSEEPKINIGCGRNLLAGWLNTDLFPYPGAVRLNACAPW